jgi:hypothetical protein
MMIITEEEIFKAISQSTGGFLNNAFFRIQESQLQNVIDDLRRRLNSIRHERGASGIRFFINEDSLLFRKVRAVIDEEGREIKFTYDAGLFGFGPVSEIFSGDVGTSGIDLDASATEGTNGLKMANDELNIFKQVIRNIFMLLSLQKSTESTDFEFNKETNYVRKLMMLHFGNKPIIQPLDVLHVFFSSRSMIDPKSAAVIRSGFSAGGGAGETILLVKRRVRMCSLVL